MASTSGTQEHKRRKSYDLNYKLDAVEFAEMNSNDYRPGGLIEAGSQLQARSRIEAGGRSKLYR